MTVTRLGLLAFFSLGVACSASARDVSVPNAAPPEEEQNPADPKPAGSTPTPNIVAGDASVPVERESEVYGHSGSQLYRLDPNTKAVSLVGDFDGCTNITDIALDANSLLFGASSKGLYRIDRKTAHCTKIADGQYPNSLSFVPKGTVDANEEALVGYDASTYVRIDTKTGAITTIGSLSDGYKSSGDIVSVKDGGTYLTVYGNGCNDCIVEVNPTTGDMIRKIGDLGHQKVYGLAFWGGTAYGFDWAGNLFEVDLSGSAPKTTDIKVPKAPSDLSFWGAGSTTSAPATAVK